MPTITIPSFAGEVPKTTPRLLDNNQAAIAINCQLERGELSPLKGPLLIQEIKESSRTIFKHSTDGWLSWPGVVNVVKSAVYDYTGEKPLGQLFMTGAEDYPTQYLAGGIICRLGIPRPALAPNVNLKSGAKSGTVRCYAWGSQDSAHYPSRYGMEDGLNGIEADNVGVSAIAEAISQEQALAEGVTTDSGIERSSSYCYTYVQSMADGVIQYESAPSPASPIVDIMDGDGVIVSGFVFPELPGLTITHIRLYRTMSGEQTSEFHFLAELEVPVADYIDTTHDCDLDTEVLQTTTWDPIPDDAEGLILTNNGIYACFRGNELLISEPNHGYVFPTDYRLTVEDRIVALGHTDNTIIVLTEGRPYLVTGTEPAQMQLTHLPIEQACVSARSVAHVPGGLIYASPDGLMIFTANDQTLITNATFTREQWQNLGPENIIGAVLDDKYVGIFAGTNKGLIFTIGAKDVVRIELPDTMSVMGMYQHSLDDCIYLSIDCDGQHGIWQWEEGEELDYIWRSKPFFTSRLVTMRALRIEGNQRPGRPALANVYGPNPAKAREKLRLVNTRTKRITATRAEKLWSIEIKGKTTVFEARLGSSVEGMEYGG